jgi:predicted anti-sigma-YlaC factor YlaD
MNCSEVEELILESFDAPVQRERLNAHLAHCPACREFFDAQRALDVSLLAQFPAPNLSASFDAGLRRRIALERRQAILEHLPTVLHLGGGVAGSLLCAWLLPFATSAVVSIGIAITLGTYLLLALVCDDV